MNPVRSASRWFDERLGSAHFTRKAVNKVFPDHWSFMLGEVAAYCFLILVATGIYLTLFFEPSHTPVVYHGSYAPLRGLTMSSAYASSINLSFDVRAGLLMRQMHHWAALVFLWSILAHLCRIFFTGAFRKPRELNWLVGVTLLVLVVMNDFLGYSLLDDLLSGTGLRIAYSIVEAVPVVGTWTAFLFFGGKFPGTTVLQRVFIAHVLVVPLLIFGLLGIHLAVIWRQKHTQFPGPGRRDDNVVGSRLWPVYTAKSVGLFALLTSVIAFMGAYLQINPIWLYGPYEPASSTTYAQPDYALGWVEGAMRIFPGWELVIAHRYRVPAAFWPAVFFPAATFLILYAWPWIDKRVTHDRAEHHVIDRPRDRPGRSAFGIAVLTLYAILLLAGSQDIIASQLNTTIQPVTWSLRIGVLVVPVVFGLIALKLFRDLNASHEQPVEVDEPEAPNEVPPEDAPSPVGPAPELLPAALRGAEPEAIPVAVGAAPERGLGRIASEVVAVLIAGIVDAYAWLRSRRRRRRGPRRLRQAAERESVNSR